MPFDATALCQQVYDAIHAAIKGLPNEQAVEVVEQVAGHCEAMAESMREEMDE